MYITNVHFKHKFVMYVLYVLLFFPFVHCKCTNVNNNSTIKTSITNVHFKCTL